MLEGLEKSRRAVKGTGDETFARKRAFEHPANRLVVVDRSVTPDATLEDLLGQVITGPTEVEQTLGITTAVPAGTLASVETSRGTASAWPGRDASRITTASPSSVKAV